MKIVQAIGWYYPDSLGGTEVYVDALSQRLQSAGREVIVAAPDPGSRSIRKYCHNDIAVLRYPTTPDPTRAECQSIVPTRGSERFHEWMQVERPDVVHFHTFVTGLGIWEIKAAKRAGAKVIATTHAASLGYICQRGTMMHWGEQLCDGICEAKKCTACELQHRGLSKSMSRIAARAPSWIGSVPGKFGTMLGMNSHIKRNQRLQREMLSHVDRFVLLTRWALEAVAKNGAPREKLALNRLGLSQTTASRKPCSTQAPTTLPLRVGYLGRFDPIKGVFDLARAIAHLDKNVPIEFEFRGPITSNAEQSVVDKIKQIVGKNRCVEFATAVPSSEVPQVLASYDVLCCPPVCLEGGPTVAIEAHAVGTPVIGTKIGGLAEIVGDGKDGQLVPPGDWRKLAGVFNNIAQEPAIIDRWRCAIPPARNMDQVAHEYLQLYTA